jgi:2Fe-2S ferredoxin
MPSITFRPITAKDESEDVTFQTEEGASILETALSNDFDLEHACGGFCACTTCHIVVKTGGDSLSEMDFDEEDKLDEVEGVTLESRLGCQARVAKTDLIVLVPQRPY